MPVDEVHQGRASGDYVKLVPFPGFVVLSQFPWITDHGEHGGFLARGQSCADDLAAIGSIGTGRDAAPRSGAALYQRSRVAVLIVQISLIASRLPLRIFFVCNWTQALSPKL